MFWRRRARKSYRDVVEDLAAEAFAVDLLKLPGFETATVEPMLNTLEGVAALNFLLTRALATPQHEVHIQLAITHLQLVLIDELAESYSPQEMVDLVIPLLERRHTEYSKLLNGDGAPGDRIIDCGRTMIENFCDVSLAEPAMSLAAGALFKFVAIDAGRKVRELDAEKAIDWTE
jgi:hypothetical protein